MSEYSVRATGNVETIEKFMPLSIRITDGMVTATDWDDLPEHPDQVPDDDKLRIVHFAFHMPDGLFEVVLGLPDVVRFYRDIGGFLRMVLGEELYKLSPEGE